MKFLVAGAGGFIGGHLVNRLLNLGYEYNNADHIKKKRKLCHVFYKTKEERGG